MLSDIVYHHFSPPCTQVVSKIKKNQYCKHENCQSWPSYLHVLF